MELFIGVDFMATSSFNRNVKITKDNYQSLLDIVNDDAPIKASFEGVRKIELVKKEDLGKWFKWN